MSPRERDRVTRIWRGLAVMQLRRPRSLLLLFVALAGIGLWRAWHLTVVTDFTDLLSPDQPSVKELRRIVARTKGLSNVFVVLEGPDPEALRALADTLLPRLRAIGSPSVESAASGIQAARRFLLPRAGMFLFKPRNVHPNRRDRRAPIGRRSDRAKPAAKTRTVGRKLR
jgi:hypothetical protein